MYEEINRFIGHPDQVANFDSFFGTPAWRACVDLLRPTERNRCLHDLYLRQLKTTAQGTHVRSFRMRNLSGLTDYYLFYGTKSLLGLKKMKEAMWAVDKSGEFTFSDATDPNQLVLFGSEPRYELLRHQILIRFHNKETTVGDIEDFVVADTAFRETHYKQNVLKPLELSDPPRMKVLNAPPGRRRGTYAMRSMRVRFLDQQ